MKPRRVRNPEIERAILGCATPDLEDWDPGSTVLLFADGRIILNATFQEMLDAREPGQELGDVPRAPESREVQGERGPDHERKIGPEKNQNADQKEDDAQDPKEEITRWENSRYDWHDQFTRGT